MTALKLSHLLIKPPQKPLSKTIPPLIIMHGLFGSSKNWLSVSKSISQALNTDIYAIDLRNHGHSPLSPSMSYLEMAQDIVRFCSDHQLSQRRPFLVGHSMGGKVAMYSGLVIPNLFSGIISIDMPPLNLPLSPLFPKYVSYMQTVEERQVTSISEADKILQPLIPELSIRQFLLTNIVRDPSSNKLKFRIPLSYLTNRIFNDLNQFQIHLIPNTSTPIYNGPVSILGAAKAQYVCPTSIPEISRIFPKCDITMVDAGHWIHAEQPQLVIDHIKEFVLRVCK